MRVDFPLGVRPLMFCDDCGVMWIGRVGQGSRLSLCEPCQLEHSRAKIIRHRAKKKALGLKANEPLHAASFAGDRGE